MIKFECSREGVVLSSACGQCFDKAVAAAPEWMKDSVIRSRAECKMRHVAPGTTVAVVDEDLT